MDEGGAGSTGPFDARDQDPRLRKDVLEFLRNKAFPTWDFFDAAARRQLLREYHGAEVGEAVARRVRSLGSLNPHLLLTTVLRPDIQVSATALRQPRPPRRRLFGGIEREDNSIEALDSGVTVVIIDLSALGPYGMVTWMWPRKGLDSPDAPATLEADVLDALRKEGIEVLTRDEGLIPVRGMKGTPFGKGKAIPNVINCLFDEVSFWRRGLVVSGLRFRSSPGDLWPSVVEGVP